MRINERTHRETTNGPTISASHRNSHHLAPPSSPSHRSFGEVLSAQHDRAPQMATEVLSNRFPFDRDAREGGAAMLPDAREQATEELMPVEPVWRPFETVVVQDAAPAAPVPARDAVAAPIIQAIAVAVDAHQRKLLFLRVSVPGRGGVDVRLRRGMNGLEVLLSCEDESLRRDLVARRGELADRGRAANLGLSRIEIAG